MALVTVHQGPPVRIRRISKPEPYKAPGNHTPKKKRAKARLYEHQEQVALFKWAAMLERQIPALANLYAIPNAAKRNAVAAAMLKAEGLKAGVPDTHLPWPAQGLPGLFLEMKTPGRKPTDEQMKWRGRLVAAGYRYVLCFSWTQAANAILEYLGPEYSRYRVA